jgi:hypothetical protein
LIERNLSSSSERASIFELRYLGYLGYLGEASVGYSYGITTFPLRILDKPGWAPISIEVWSHTTGTPLTEATAFLCIVAKDGDDCGPKPAKATVDTLSGVDLAGRSESPDAALHISERDSRMIGVFKCNASFCQDHEYHAWEIGQPSAWLISKLASTLNLLSSQEAYAQAHNSPPGTIESQYITAGRAIFDNMFYSEQHDSRLLPVIANIQALVAESKRRALKQMNPPSLFARVMPTSAQFLVVPWGLMVPSSSADPLGASVEIESPLPLQSYQVPASCISNWELLVPPPRTQDPDDALSAVFLARDQFESWIDRFQTSCPSCVNFDPPKFGDWLTTNAPPSGPTGIVVLSHHSTDGNTDAYYFDADVNGYIGPAAYSNISRSFPDPSFAVLGGCGTGKPESSEFVHQFNRGGVYSVISTALDVNPEMAGKFPSLFLMRLSENDVRNDHTVGRARWLAVQDLSRTFGPRAYVFSLNGNGTIKACVPQTNHTAAIELNR